MYRLLIVDDEEIIVNGLYEIFSSLKKLDLDVYKAYSGEEAIEWLNRTRIDIVLTDIRMPEIDGLQLLDKIYQSWPQCKVIFLTGYNEFEYVYRAIQHSGVSYILKTEDHEQVINAVENAIKEIQKGLKIEDLVQKAKEQINMAREMFQKEYFIHLLHEDPSLNISKPQFEELGIPMYPDKPVILLLGHVDNIPDLSYWDKIQFLYSVRLIISQNLNPHIRSVIVIDESYRFVLFIQPKELLTVNQIETENEFNYKKTVSFLRGTLEAIQAGCRESLDTSVSFALGGEPCRWEDAAKKYYSLSKLLNYRIGTGIETILIDSESMNNILNVGQAYEVPELEADTEPLERLLQHRNHNTLELYLESGQKDEFFGALAGFIDPLKTIRSKNSNIALETYYKLALILLSFINRRKLTEKIAFQIGQNKLMRTDQYESWAEAVEYIYQISNVIFKLQTEEQEKRADNVISYIQKYVEEHLGEDLSLVRLAEQVYLNPSYLSRLYKQFTGANLSDFIDNARIKKAKELLEGEKLKISDVAKSVGYETAASFTRFFRKVTARSPQEYQSAILRANNDNSVLVKK